jgi:hypothetical protein
MSPYPKNIYMFCVILTSSKYFPKYEESVGLCNGDVLKLDL